MSSSKIFKQDKEFTPTPLVRHDLSELTSPPETEEPEEQFLPEPDLHAEEPIPEEQEPAPMDQEIQQEPEIDIEALREEAYNQGVRDAGAEFDAEIRPAVEAFLSACQKIDTQRRLLLDRYRGDIINTIMALSKKIIGDELQTKRDVIASTLEKALHQALAGDEFIVTLNPEDVKIIEEKQNELIAGIRGLENLVIKTDEEVGRGGCLLDSKTCFIDATIESQLKNIEEYLKENTNISEIDSDDVQ